MVKNRYYFNSPETRNTTSWLLCNIQIDLKIKCIPINSDVLKKNLLFQYVKKRNVESTEDVLWCIVCFQCRWLVTIRMKISLDIYGVETDQEADEMQFSVYFCLCVFSHHWDAWLSSSSWHRWVVKAAQRRRVQCWGPCLHPMLWY